MLRAPHGIAIALTIGLAPTSALAGPPKTEQPAATAPELEAAEPDAARPPAPELLDAPAPEPAPEPEPPPAPVEGPPRISGTFLGMAIWPAVSWAVSPNMEVDQSAPLGGGGGALRLGQAVLPWLTISVDAGGAFLWNRNAFFMKGGLLIDFGFYPVPKYPFSIHTGFGFGAGLILDDRTDVKGGVGGPRFTGALRYEFFPGASRKRPRKPGGWALGPELAWRGFTPSGGFSGQNNAGRERPMANTIVLGLWFGYYWGK